GACGGAQPEGSGEQLRGGGRDCGGRARRAAGGRRRRGGRRGRLARAGSRVGTPPQCAPKVDGGCHGAATSSVVTAGAGPNDIYYDLVRVPCFRGLSAP